VGLLGPTGGETVVTEDNGAAVHMAVGVLMERHNCDAAQAMAMLRSAALTAGRNIGALAVEIVDGARHGVTDD
jgi:AmiR/NasT family two-component response regulator